MSNKSAKENSTVNISAMILGPSVFMLFLTFLILTYFNYQFRLRNFKGEADKILANFLRAANTENYLCESLTKIFDDSAQTDGLKTEIIRFFQQHNLEIEYIVWNSNGTVLHSSDTNAGLIFQKFPETYENLLSFKQKGMIRDSQDLDSKGLQLKRVFGPLFDPFYHSNCYEGKNLHLIRTDSSGRSPLLWIRASQKFALAVKIPHETIKKSIGLKNLVESMKGAEIIAGFRKGNEIVVSGNIPKNLIKLWLDNTLSGNKIQNGYFLHKVYIDSQTSAFCAIPHEQSSYHTFDRHQKKLVLMVVFCLLMIFAINSKLLKKQKVSGLSVKAQMLLLFLVANMITGTVIGLVLKDYFDSLKKSLRNKAAERMLKSLQNADDLFENEYTFQKLLIESELTKLKAQLKRFGIKHEAVKSFIDAQSPSPPYRMYLIGSNTPYLASEDGIITATATLSVFTNEIEKHPFVLQQLRRMFKIGQYYLSLLNREKLDAKTSVEVETMVEALSRQTPIEQMLEYFEHDKKFWHWGFGNRNFPAYIETFSVNDSESFDYVFLYLWGERNLQSHYLKRSINLLNRAESGIRILAVDDYFAELFPADLLNEEQLRKLYRLIQHDTGAVKQFTLAGKENLLVHYKGEKLNKFFWVALVPFDRIDSSIDSQKSLIFQLGFLCLVFSAFVGVWLSNLILIPLNELGLGAEALQKRHFKYRIPVLGNDEFGVMANHLNSTLIDYEELQVASMVKSKLLDSMEQALDVGANSIFAKTFVNPGDHFLAIDKDLGGNLEILVAAPEASGVVASLIQAFIRAVLIHFEHLKMLPVQRLAKILEILTKSSRSHQNGLAACLDIVFKVETDSISFCRKEMTIFRPCFQQKAENLAGISTEKHLEEQLYLEEIVLEPGEILVFSTHPICEPKAVTEKITEICKRNLSLPEMADLFRQSILDRLGASEINSDITMLIVRKN